MIATYGRQFLVALAFVMVPFHFRDSPVIQFNSLLLGQLIARLCWTLAVVSCCQIYKMTAIITKVLLQFRVSCESAPGQSTATTTNATYTARQAHTCHNNWVAFLNFAYVRVTRVAQVLGQGPKPCRERLQTCFAGAGSPYLLSFTTSCYVR